MTRTNVAVNDGAVLKALDAERAGRTQKAFAKELGITPQYLSDIVNGQRRITTLMADKLGFELVWRRRKG